MHTLPLPHEGHLLSVACSGWSEFADRIEDWHVVPEKIWPGMQQSPFLVKGSNE